MERNNRRRRRRSRSRIAEAEGAECQQQEQTEQEGIARIWMLEQNGRSRREPEIELGKEGSRCRRKKGLEGGGVNYFGGRFWGLWKDVLYLVDTKYSMQWKRK
jgi:hypothetical protein